ncbi:MAG: TIGR00269 family protein [Candidatus Micrarchaeota archaeon]
MGQGKKRGGTGSGRNKRSASGRPAPGREGSECCHRCGRSACISNWAGAGLCRTHFEEEFAKKVGASVREFSMILPGEHVAVALSGGKDSVTLLHMLARLGKRLPMKLSALLVDEGIGGYRPKTVQVARKECRKLGVKLHIVSFEKEFGMPLDRMLKTTAQGDAGSPGAAREAGGTGLAAHASDACRADKKAKKAGAGGKTQESDAGRLARSAEPPSRKRQGACTYCGVFRRYLLNAGAARLGADKLAMGHNLDDAAQTVLLNLFRNEPARLARFWPAPKPEEGRKMFVPRIMPLIRCYEKEIATWAVLNDIRIEFMSCPYAQEAMRQQVRRLLNDMEEKYPGTKSRMFNAFLRMRPWLAKGAAAEEGGGLMECARCGEASASDVCAACRLLEGMKNRRR